MSPEIAEKIARKAHAGQFRRDGLTPYIEHPKEVAEICHHWGSLYEMVAWLHDVLEDGNLSEWALRKNNFPDEVLDAVSDLTKRPGESYKTYLIRVKCNPVALRVKLADIIHNLSDDPTPKQVKKYADALRFLEFHT